MRILVVRIGRAGDIIMSTPALNAIFDQYPQAQVTVLTSPDGNRLLKNYHPRLTDIWVWNRSGLLGYSDKRKIVEKLSSSHFDIIFSFDTNKRIIALFNGTDADFFWQSSQDNTIHCAENYLNLVQRACGSLDKNYYAHLPLRSESQKRLSEELLSHGITADDTVVMLHPTYSGYSNNPVKQYLKRNNRSTIHRLWPARNYAQLADMLSSLKLSNGQCPKIIIDLIPDEAPMGRAVLRESKGNIQLIQTQPNFERYKALIERANLLIVPNTGPMHIAAAMSTKVVALFSGWDPVDCGPYMNPSLFKIIKAEDMCRPEQGLSAISPDKVYHACKQLLL